MKPARNKSSRKRAAKSQRPPSGSGGAPDILQFRIWLKGVSPMVWRRLQVPATMTLYQLHGVFQVTMGWESIHLYQFVLYAVRYGSWETAARSPDVPLGDLRLPQTFIDGKRIGGYDDLLKHFGQEVKAKDGTSYQPIIATFAVAFLMALAVSWYTFGNVLTIRAFDWFIAISMCILAIQKLQDLESFSTMFLNYDLLARRWVRYGYLYPFGEALAGILMVAGALIWIAAPVALFIGTVGAVSVFKAVYVDKRELKCACVGGASKVPLGFVSLTENLMMIAMAIAMPVRMWWTG